MYDCLNDSKSQAGLLEIPLRHLREILMRSLDASVAKDVMTHCPVSMLGKIEDLALWAVRANTMDLFLYLLSGCVLDTHPVPRNEVAHHLDAIPNEHLADALELQPSHIYVSVSRGVDVGIFVRISKFCAAP